MDKKNTPFYQIPGTLAGSTAVLGVRTYQPTDEADGTQPYYTYQGIGKTQAAPTPTPEPVEYQVIYQGDNVIFQGDNIIYQ